MLIDTKHLASIPCRLLPALLYLMSQANGQTPDPDGFVAVTCRMGEMAQKLRKTRRSVMGNLRDLEITRDVIREYVPGYPSRYRVRVRSDHA